MPVRSPHGRDSIDDTVINISGLRKTYPGHVLFDDADLVVGRGERVGIVGRNGTGKSTLLRIVAGDETADGGSVVLPKRYTVGHVAQHLRFEGGSVLEEAESALRPNADGWVETHRAEAVLSGLGFDDDLCARHPDVLSGGFRMRLALARVLLAEPDLLLLDEPTNHLDVVSVRWLERFLRGWRGEVLLVTHDRAFMDAVCTHTAALTGARFRKVSGGTAKLYSQLAQEAETESRMSANAERRRREILDFAARFRAKATKARAVQSRLKRLEEVTVRDADREGTAGIRFTSAPFPGKTLLEMRSISFAWERESPILQDLSLTIGPGDRVGVAGPNGSGKTTFLRLVAGDLDPDSGQVKRSPNLETGWFGQSAHTILDESRTVEEEILDSLEAANRTRARGLAGRMLFRDEDAEKRICVLSGGERSRVLLTKVMAAPVNLLLLDEPTHHLDIETVEALSEALDAFRGAVVLVTHDEELLERHAERLLVFDDGTVTCHEAGYADFLERVGWSAERDTSAESRELEEDALTRGSGDRVSRKARRQEVARRNATLRPLQSEVSGLERAITSVETEVAKLESAIALAASSGNGVEVTRLAHDLHELHGRRESLYEELAEASERLEGLLTELDAVEAL